MANRMVSGTAVPLAAVMALRSEPAPALLALLTVNVAACAEPAAPSAKRPAPSAPAMVLRSMTSPSWGGGGGVAEGDLRRPGQVGPLAELARWRSAGGGQRGGPAAEVVQRRAVH